MSLQYTEQLEKTNQKQHEIENLQLSMEAEKQKMEKRFELQSTKFKEILQKYQDNAQTYQQEIKSLTNSIQTNQIKIATDHQDFSNAILKQKQSYDELLIENKRLLHESEIWQSKAQLNIQLIDQQSQSIKEKNKLVKSLNLQLNLEKQEAEEKINQFSVNKKEKKENDKITSLLQELCKQRTTIGQKQREIDLLTKNDTEMREQINNLISERISMESKNQYLQKELFQLKETLSINGTQELLQKISELKKISEFFQQDSMFVKEKCKILQEVVEKNLNLTGIFNNTETEALKVEMMKLVTQCAQKDDELRKLRKQIMFNDINEYQEINAEMLKNKLKNENKIVKGKLSPVKTGRK